MIGNTTDSSNDGELAQPQAPRHVVGVIRSFPSLVAVVLGLLSAGVVRADDAASRNMAAKVVVIPVREQISNPELYILRRGLKEAIENKVDTIVLDMETPGGSLDVTFEMLKALEKFPGKTVTYVNREAMSAGALISAGTDEIYFAPGAVIGAAAPVSATGEAIDPVMREKIVSYLKARVRSISEGKGYRGKVVSAMIDLDSEFKIGDEVIKEKGELLSLTAQEAVKTYGDPPLPLLGTGIAENLDALLNRLHGAGNYTVERLEITWSEKLAQYLTAVTPVLLGIGLLLMFIEFKTPGFGIFGISGMVVLSIVFFSQFVAGLSGHEPILFFLLGVVLLAVELLLFPGSFVIGLAGISLMLGSLVWSMTDLWPSQPILISGDVFVKPLINVMSGIVLAVVFFFALLRFLPQGGLWSGMVLEAAVGGEPPVVGALAGGGTLIGEIGIAATALFPSGQVDIGGRRYEARVDMGFAEAGSTVKVTGLAEFGLTVEVVS